MIFMKSLFIAFIFSLSSSHAANLTTIAEKSGWKKTGNAEETASLCREFQKEFPKQVKCLSYGTTPQNRTLHYLVVGDPKKPVVWVQAGIHAGEIDGKDSTFLLVREIVQNKILPNPLTGLCLVFVPIVNLDGHERIGKWNRPNQIGPEEMGWRTTAQNYNMNRDFMKADSAEMNHLLKLWHKMDPVLSLDLHVTDGAQFQPEVGVIVLPNDYFGNSNLHKAGKIFETYLVDHVNRSGHKALPFYPSFEEDDVPTSGFSRYVATARFAHGYWYNNNRLGMLVETHSWKDYATRVQTHHDTVLSALYLAQQSAGEWRKAAAALDQQNLAETKVELEFKHTDKFRTIDFEGYKYKIQKSAISGGDVIRYDSSAKETWKVPFYEELKPTLVVTAPKEGYYIPASESWLVEKLVVHDIKTHKIKRNIKDEFEVFRATKTTLSHGSFEGHQTLVVEGKWQNEKTEIQSGSFFVPVKQPKARLLLQLLEPQAVDSYLAWGMFNRFFERKEYMENYVAEDVAIEMLKTPEIKKEFELKLKDETFAKDPEQRYHFFYQKHASWDKVFNRYPVFKK